jgi:CHAD domain-containing protein
MCPGELFVSAGPEAHSGGSIGFANAYKKHRVEDFHEWRKQVKYLWYQVRLLRELWPDPLKQLADELKTLTDYLSDDHDLAMLRERVLAQAENSNDQTEREAIVALIDQRRAELQVLARLLGERLYVENFGAFKNRFHDYWRVWQSEQEIDPIAVSLTAAG